MLPARSTQHASVASPHTRSENARSMAFEEGDATTPAPKTTWWNPLHALRALQRMGDDPDPEHPVRKNIHVCSAPQPAELPQRHARQAQIGEGRVGAVRSLFYMSSNTMIRIVVSDLTSSIMLRTSHSC